MRYPASEKLEIIRYGRGLASADAANPEDARYPQQHLLRLVCPVERRWRIGGSLTTRPG